MYRKVLLSMLALILLCALSGCTLRPVKPDSDAELALGGGQALGYNLRVLTGEDGEPCILTEFVYHFNGSLYETGLFELQQLLKNQYRVVISGQGWVQYKQFVVTDGRYSCPLGEIAVDVKNGVCCSRTAVVDGFDPEKATLDVRRMENADENP